MDDAGQRVMGVTMMLQLDDMYVWEWVFVCLAWA